MADAAQDGSAAWDDAAPQESRDTIDVPSVSETQVGQAAGEGDVGAGAEGDAGPTTARIYLQVNVRGPTRVVLVGNDDRVISAAPAMDNKGVLRA